MVGERVDGAWASPANTTGRKNLATIPLTAGTWMLYGKSYLQGGGTAATSLSTELSISSSSGAYDTETGCGFANTLVAQDTSITCMPKRVVTTGATFYLVGNWAAGSGAPVGFLSENTAFYAIRIA
jgi:hypothetical protein